MKKLVVAVLLSLTVSLAGCGSESKEASSTGLEVSGTISEIAKKAIADKSDVKVSIVADASNKSIEKVSVSEESTEESVEESGESSTSNGSNSTSNSGNSNSRPSNSGNSNSNSNTGNSNSNSGNSGSGNSNSNSTSGNSSSGNGSSGNSNGNSTSGNSNSNSNVIDDDMPDDWDDGTGISIDVPEQEEVTPEDGLRAALTEQGVTNYVLSGGWFIDYDGYTILLDDGVVHNIWKGTDYGTSSPYPDWSGGCASFGYVPAGWNSSWTASQVEAAMGF